MTSFLRKALSRLLSITVNTYHVKATDLERVRREKHEQLARECGLTWPKIKTQ